MEPFLRIAVDIMSIRITTLSIPILSDGDDLADCLVNCIAECCIVLAEGEMRIDGVFDVKAMGFPPIEPREDVLRAMKVSGGQSPQFDTW